MKKLIYILMIGFCFTLVSCATLSGNKSSNQRFNKKYEIITVEEKLNYLDTKILYPQFKNEPELNKRIENSIINNWKSFKSYSKSEWNDIAALNNRGASKLPPFEYLVTFEVSGN